MRHLQRRIIYIFLLAIASLTAFILFSYQNNLRNQQSSSEVRHSYQVITGINQVYESVIKLQFDTREYFISDQNKYLLDCDTCSREESRYIKNLRLLLQDNPTQLRRLDTFQRLVNDDINLNYKALNLRKEDYIPEARRVLSGDESITLLNGINQLVTDMLEEETSLLSKRIAHHKSIIRNTLIIEIIAAIIILLLIIYGLLRMNKDMLQRKEAVEDAKASEKKYRQLIEDARVVMFTADIRGCFNFISNRVTELTGYQKEELLDKHYSLLVDPEALSAVSEFYLEQISKRQTDSVIEFPIIMKDGRRKWVEQTAVMLFLDNEPAGFQCLVRDIDQSKRLREELEVAEKERLNYQYQLQSILDNTDLLIFMKDLDGKYLLVNRQFEKIFQRPALNILGKDDFSLVPEEIAWKYQADDQWVFSHKTAKTVQELLDTPKGKRHHMIIKFPLINTEGEPYGLCGIATDIHERVQFEEDLISARKIAVEAQKAQELFMANISHEIRTPLNGITGMAGLLGSTPLNNEQQEFLDGIRESAESLMILINDLLDFSKISAGKLNLEKIEFNLSETVRQSIFSLQFKALDKNLALNLSLAPGLPEMLVGDPYRLTQILVNLVGNAIKFTEKGTVSVEVSCCSQKEGYASILVSVKDTGIGIAKENISTLFHPFPQADSSTSRKFGGTGLGLAITRQLVELQKGHIEVESEPGKGSTFSFTIPYQLANQKTHSGTRQQNNQAFENYSLAGRHILVAEDNIINQKVILHILGKAGAFVQIEENGKAVLKALQGNHHFDALLMDIQMPEMDGYEAARYIRHQLKLSLPIIAMTAATLKGEKEKCLAAGMNGYISKPFAPDDLFRVLTGFLKQVRPEP